MKVRILVIGLTALGISFGWNTHADAIGCVSGGVAGAVAGHMAHHGVLGAIGGCIAGHEYNKHQRRASEQDQSGSAYQQQPGVDRGSQRSTQDE